MKIYGCIRYGGPRPRFGRMHAYVEANGRKERWPAELKIIASARSAAQTASLRVPYRAGRKTASGTPVSCVTRGTVGSAVILP